MAKTKTQKAEKTKVKTANEKPIVQKIGKVTIQLTKGAVISSPGSTRNYKTGEWRTYKPTINLTTCIKCGKCWMVCPDAAIKKRTEDGKFEINHDYCKGCLLCEVECPVKSITHTVDEK